MIRPSRLRLLYLSAVLGLAPLLSGCLLLAAAGTGSSVGYIATEDRSVQDNANDIVSCTQAIQQWVNYNTELNDDLTCHTYQGRMLVTGYVPKQEWRDAAIERAWKAKGVKEVYDEIQIGSSPSFGANARDTFTAQKFKARLLTDDIIHSNNYIVTIENGVMYILGSARSEAERARVVEYARNTSDVKRVVSYIRIRANPPNYTPDGNAPANNAPAPSDNTGVLPPTAPSGTSTYIPPGAPEPPPGPEDTPPNAPTPRGDITVTPLQ